MSGGTSPIQAVVYLGPSLDRDEAASLAPGAELRPPVRRGDLYRDRRAGATDFLILDGVFFQHEALPPREILDVMADGASVHGACSLGALRAVDCAPAGMGGSGWIYRLFRAGVLGSDDEVALVFDPSTGKPLSVPLVQVRWAARQLARRGTVSAEEAERWVRAARDLHYSERLWSTILENAGSERAGDDAFLAELDSLDPKARDARGALEALARRLESGTGTGRPRTRSENELFRGEEAREHPHDALAGADPAREKIELARWHLLSGRYLRHITTLAAAFPELGLEELRSSQAAAASLLTRRFPASERARLGPPLALRLAQVNLWVKACGELEAFADRLWAELGLADELDAEIFRRRAIYEGAERARDLGLVPDARHGFQATTEVLQEHRLSSWIELRRLAEPTAFEWKNFVSYRNRLAAAKRFRDHLFGAPDQ